MCGRRLAEGYVELRNRADGQSEDVPLAEISSVLVNRFATEFGKL